MQRGDVRTHVRKRLSPLLNGLIYRLARSIYFLYLRLLSGLIERPLYLYLGLFGSPNLFLVAGCGLYHQVCTRLFGVFGKFLTLTIGVSSNICLISPRLSSSEVLLHRQGGVGGATPSEGLSRHLSLVLFFVTRPSGDDLGFLRVRGLFLLGYGRIFPRLFCQHRHVRRHVGNNRGHRSLLLASDLRDPSALHYRRVTPSVQLMGGRVL